jgi:hypothetical protein
MLNSANLLQTIFDRSPRLVKRAMINLEAIRRDRFRRYGDYASELRFLRPSVVGHIVSLIEVRTSA